ncbi:hypothetical protein [Oceanisphaera psychrotolerans]|uniref:Uncharacterized protein n=1 Tax=Oceanisphaera psychrotolerans TaxID=1414654 RepID=A0A1J4QEZ0_9GAMM|nr:hypothetical protein [Oceanisphaera psychrotolerans]OIN08948.1 hypothetical protein BFR47_14910 [Oceanisphaera psychrotolerans]
MMKWLIVSLLFVHAMAFSKSYDVLFDNVPALSESVLDQQRGGFISLGGNYSIGLKMSVLVNGTHVFNSNIINLVNGAANTEIKDAGGISGLDITPLLGRGQLGYIIKNSANGVVTDARVDVDVITPINMKQYRSQQRVSSRIRAATERLGY